MNIEQRIDYLLERLAFLGYYSFQVKNIIREAIGNTDVTETNSAQRIEVINILEKYVELGSNYALAFSK